MLIRPRWGVGSRSNADAGSPASIRGLGGVAVAHISSTWAKLGTNINLRHRWGRDGSPSLAVRPFVYGSTDHLVVTPETKIYLNNVTVSHGLND
jgi:hypothetical protein